MGKFNELKQEIEDVKEKSSKYEPNSIMGVHYSSKLARLKRELGNTKNSEFETWYECEFGDLSLNKDDEGNYITKRGRSCFSAWDYQQKKIDAVLKHINDEEWFDEYGDHHCPTYQIKELLK